MGEGRNKNEIVQPRKVRRGKTITTKASTGTSPMVPPPRRAPCCLLEGGKQNAFPRPPSALCCPRPCFHQQPHLRSMGKSEAKPCFCFRRGQGSKGRGLGERGLLGGGYHQSWQCVLTPVSGRDGVALGQPLGWWQAESPASWSCWK